MQVRELMELASGEINFKILRSLHDKPMYAGDLSERLSTNVRTVRVHLHRLRKKNFVDFEKNGTLHLYHIKIPLDSEIHELIMMMIALADPIKKRGEDDEPLDLTAPDYLESRTQKNYWTTLAKGAFEILARQGTVGHMKKLHDKLQDIRSRTKNLPDD